MGEGWEGRVTSLLCLARWARGMQGEILPLGIVVVAGSAGENLEWDAQVCFFAYRLLSPCRYRFRG